MIDINDIIGKKINDWEILSYAGKNNSSKNLYNCKCKCGRIYKVIRDNLLNNTSKRCINCGKRKINPNDIVSKKINNWIVLSYEGTDKKYNHIYKCQCNCGNIRNMSRYILLTKNSTGCQKCNKGHKKDISNQKFGKLTALYPLDKRIHNSIVWRCQCECGNTRDVPCNLLSYRKVNACNECMQNIRKQKVSQARVKDLTGIRSGFLTVLYPLDKRDENKNRLWHCKCDCGNEIDIIAAKLLSKNPTHAPLSCGCKKNEVDHRINNRLGQRYGKLTVIADTGKSNHRGKIWLCQCDCGNTKEVNSNLLWSGKVRSCGCVKPNLTEFKCKNLEGKKFGKLTVLEKTNERKYGQVLWKCQCECGNIKNIPASNLVYGLTKSCGCFKKERNK